LGEGGVWVSDQNGCLNNGDYITTSDIPGYGMKQDTQMMMNYTVAKITMDCNFNPNVFNKKKVKTKIETSITYEDDFEYITTPITKYDYIVDENNKYICKESITYNTTKQEKKGVVAIYDGSGNFVGNREITLKKRVIKETEVLDLDNQGNKQYIDELDQSGNTIQMSEYKIRYLLSDGTIITKEQYETYKQNNIIVYKAAFVGCTYHCG
jgi:hypothetical protein